MRGPDSLPPWVTSDDWQADPEPILSVVCPCCKGRAHLDSTPCEFGIDLLITHHTSHAFLNTPLAELPGCMQCFDSGVVPVDQYTEEVL